MKVGTIIMAIFFCLLTFQVSIAGNNTTSQTDEEPALESPIWDPTSGPITVINTLSTVIIKAIDKAAEVVNSDDKNDE
jgi:hypothetical protein